MKPLILQAKPQSNLVAAITLLAMLLFATSQANAQTPTYYWDANGAADGAGDPPNGDWYEFTPCWTLDPYGASPAFYYSNRADIVFAATGDFFFDPTVDFSYTITVHGIAQVGNILFRDGNCTLTTPPGYYLDKDTPFICVLNDGQTATINSVIASTPGTSNGITKYAFGTLVLGSTNTYRGPTTVEGGTLRLAGPQLLPKNSTLVLAGGDDRPNDGWGNTPATFHTGGYSQTLGPLCLTGPNPSLPHTIDFGHGASALAFAGSQTQDWGGILLYIAHFKPGLDSLRFGTNSSGLSTAQLALLRFTSSLDVPGRIDANGFVTPVPPPTLSVKRTEPTGITIDWDSINGRTYNLQYKPSPAAADWITNAITDVVAAGTVASYTDNAATNEQRVYRLRLKAIYEGTK